MLPISKKLRSKVISIIEKNRRGHIGPAFSLIEILWSIYDSDFSYDNSSKANFDKRDRLILSKGHGCLALYAVLNEKGILPNNLLSSFCEFNSFLGGHPERNVNYGIEASTGSLGHGLSIGIGIAKGLFLKKNNAKTFVILGDGEINEGSIWEGALSASKHKLNNLIVYIDYNKMQAFGSSEDVINIEPLHMKLKSFGFDVYEVDGHSIKDLKFITSKIRKKNNLSPSAVICHTTKGYGIDFMENNPEWHHKSKITDDEFKQIYSALS